MTNFKEEMWRQNRKDRRAYLEFISSTNKEINHIHSVLAKQKKSNGIFSGGKQQKSSLIERLNDAVFRINTFWDEINKINGEIKVLEEEILDGLRLDSENKKKEL
jgi:hypothetical protein